LGNLRIKICKGQNMSCVRSRRIFDLVAFCYRPVVDEAALEELAASRPQLISLNVREHCGTEATVPYSIEPSQLVRTTLRL